MAVERGKMIQNAEEFQRLVKEVLAEFPEMDPTTAERIVIHAGHKNIEQIVMDLFDVLVAYVDARGQNSAQLNGMIKSIVERVKNRK
jgi:hypothetical protein